jgi:hypothetical protein
MHSDATVPKDSTERQLDPSPCEARLQDPPAICSDDGISWPLVGGNSTQISKGDVSRVAERLWRAVKIGRNTYAYTTLDHRRVYLHRFLLGEFKYWDQAKGKWRTAPVDHRNGQGLDNTRRNLRLCTPSQNQMNGSGKPTVRRSRFKGVSFCKNAKRRPWRVTITIDSRNVHGGFFESEEAAARRYDELAMEYFGEFAKLHNIPARTSIEESTC